ncbi:MULTISPECIES: alpha/beta hydrolase [Metabacillus]|uniref:Alpha/beta hydrolase n=1 Tax=Metabacillus hrfriensis TaxID=3048891 RepID=A0ACD4RFI4_9BACI|nr:MULTISPECIES: alpha/beta hydrolase [Metabacillus]UOK59793.1 alpha/beta hydrolase [Bacillus sp. OVS6]WHZ59300.1 alpha/beta hydrolase [Metabacillus sp. CT-WN-B3]
MKIITDSVIGFKDANIPFTLLSKNSNTKSLAIMLPGLGYTAQGPLFHYSTGVFLNKNADVLHINYQYNAAFYESFTNEEIDEALKRDVRNVIDTVLSAHTYSVFYLIGKSLGTIALASELGRTAFFDAKVIWLTPLLNREDVFGSIVKSKKRGLCMIGDKDPYYKEDRFQQLKDNPILNSVLIPEANHSLELDGDPVGSVDILKAVIAKIEAF